MSDFVFPDESSAVDLGTFLGPRDPSDSPCRLPPIKQANARTHVLRESARLEAAGQDLSVDRRLLPGGGLKGESSLPVPDALAYQGSLAVGSGAPTWSRRNAASPGS